MSRSTPTSLPRLWDDLSLRPYLGEIRRRHGIVEILALPSMRDLPPLRIETLFVPPLLAKNPVSTDSDIKQWPQGENLFNALERNHRLVVLGGPGSGKTTLANWLAWRLSAGSTAPLPKVLEDRVPLPCVLREMEADIFTDETTLPKLMERVARRLLGDKVDAALLDSLRQRVAVGNYVLILDGVDEIPELHRKAVVGWVRQAAAQQACVLATSRLIGYEALPIDQEETAFTRDLESPKQSLDRPEKKNAWAERCYLMPFDNDRITAFIENWYRQRCGTVHDAREKTADFLAALGRSEVAQRLARTPNLLALMAIVHREHTGIFSDGKALLYGEIANAYINTIDSQRKIEPDDGLAPFGSNQRRAWLARIGFEMQLRRSTRPNKRDGKAEMMASKDEVRKVLEDAMKVSGVTQPVKTAETYLVWVARRSGLLLPRGDKYYAFVHPSFQEYFCACFLKDCIVNPNFVMKGRSSDGLVRRTWLRQWGGESIWRETLVFLFEVLSIDQSSWIKQLVEILFGREAEAEFDYIHAALAARVLANRYVHLDPEDRKLLANRCGVWGMRGWYRYGSPKYSVLITLLNMAGYASIVALKDSDASSGVKQEDNSNSLIKGVYKLQEIANNAQLRALIVKGHEITNISPLAGLSELRGLGLSGTSVKDLEPLRQLTALQWLDLTRTKVESIASLKGLTALRQIDLNETPVNDITPLQGLGHLRVLDLTKTRVTDMDPLRDIQTLEWLDLTGMKICGVEPLSNLTALQYLSLRDTSVGNLKPLENLKALRQLIVRARNVVDLQYLSALERLQRLDLKGTAVEDLKPLESLDALRELDLGGTRVTDLNPLAKLIRLRELDLSDTEVTDLSPLVGCESLEQLDLRGAKVADLAPLEKLTALRKLYIRETGTDVPTPRTVRASLEIIREDEPTPLEKGKRRRAPQSD